MPVFTPTEQRIINLLSDGNAHSITELRGCLNDDQAVASTIHAHLTYLRKKLRPIGQDIVCRRQSDTSYYAHTRLMKINS